MTINLNGKKCEVIAGTHKGKKGKIADANVSATGATTITVIEADGNRFKTLAKNVRIS
jgi:ribosomal protein S4E